MTLSRLAPALPFALVPAGAAAAPTVTADQALTNYRKAIKPTQELDCPKGENPEEIVVCGRDGETQGAGLPLGSTRAPGERVSGGGMSGRDAMGADGCISRCQGSVSIPLHKLPGFIGKVIDRLKDN